jgi:multidrug efflux pump subunit AcrB
MAGNSVAANLGMVVIIAGGLLGLSSVKQEVFPEFALPMINIQVPYPGASPAEVEQGIILALEEAVSGIDGVKRVTATALEGSATVSVELLLGADPDTVLSDVTSAVDRIQTFPEEAEEPTISVPSMQMQVISMVLAGDQPLSTLHELAERARRQLLDHPEITQVELDGVRPLEISIEVPREALEAYGLTLDGIARQVRAASVELPGGGVETRGGEILVRMADRRRRGNQFGQIVLRGTNTGAELRLGDIASIRDGYADTDQESTYNGQRAVRLTAYRVGDETPAGVAAAVKEYARQLQEEQPEGISVALWGDTSRALNERIELLVRNAWFGFLLVLIMLGLFLRARLAGWISLGIPLSFLGAFALLPGLNLSINMITLFALIITLGLVVDDAIIVGENVYTKIQEGMPRLQAAIVGAREMAMPVTFSVLTTIAAFSPLFFMPSVMGKIFFLIPAVVVTVLVFSLLESFFVLPAHLGHGRQEEEQGPPRGWARLSAAVGLGLELFKRKLYRPVLEASLRARYVTIAVGLSCLVVSVGAVASGTIAFSFFPKIDGEVVTAAARLPFGAPLERAHEVRREIEAAAQRALRAQGGPDGILEGIYTSLAEGPPRRDGPREVGSHLVTVEVALVPPAQREISAGQIASAWEETMPTLAGLESLTFEYDTGPAHGAAVDVQLSHSDQAELTSAADRLAGTLRGYDDLMNVQNSWAPGKPQLDFRLLPEAGNYGLTSFEVGRQLRDAFFGAEALREQRGRNELKVMVRLPEGQRRSEEDLQRMLIRSPAGGFVPLHQVARFERGRAATSITREDGQRVVNLTAALAPGVASSRAVLTSLEKDIFPQLKEEHSRLDIALVGQQREQADTFRALGITFGFALIVVFALLAIPFRSYVQPLIIMATIPFGFIGAVAGHALMGYGLSIMSMMGIIALSGVVVNNSLVLIDSTNGFRRGGAGPMDAIVQGGLRRFRPILLTSFTTFCGLMPMIFETSTQAQFLVPMAISLGFGILFSSLISLLLVPSFYLLVEDLQRLRQALACWFRSWWAPSEPSASAVVSDESA